MSSLLAASGAYALSQTAFGKKVTSNIKESFQDLKETLRNAASSNGNKRAGKKAQNINKLVKPKAGVPAGSSAMVNTTVSNGRNTQSVKMDIAPMLSQVDSKYRGLTEVVEAHEEAVDDLSERMDSVEASIVAMQAIVAAEGQRVQRRSAWIDGGLVSISKSLIKVLNVNDTPVNNNYRFLATALEEGLNFADISDSDRPLLDALNGLLYAMAFYDPTRGLSSLLTDTATTTTTTTTTASDPFAAL